MNPRPHLRKFRLEDAQRPNSPANGEIDLRAVATLGYSLEDPDHPIEHLVDASSGVGATYWASARQDCAERLLVKFDTPQTISRLIYEVFETERSRTQEVRFDASENGGKTYRQLLVQEYSFSPGGATFQREDLHFNSSQVSDIRLTIVPNKIGSGIATLSNLRLFN